MKIAWPAKQSFTEAIQYGYEYVLLGEKYEALHAPIQCKDFLQDAFWSEHMKQPASIYEFSWRPGTIDPKAARYHLAVRYNAQPFTKYATASLAFLHEIERALKFRPCALVMDATNTIGVFTFDRAWTVEPILLSAFTLFLRVGATYPGGNVMEFLSGFNSAVALANCDVPYVAKALPRIKEMLAGRASFSQTWAQYGPDNIQRLHNRSGIVSYKETEQ